MVEAEALAGRLVAALRSQGRMLACAESMTGGLFAATLTRVAGASAVFRGGVVAYTPEAKMTLLGLDAAVLQDGAADEPVTRAMAESCRMRLEAEVGVALTGYAGPAGPPGRVGEVFIAVSTASGTTVRHLQLGGGRDDVRRQAVVTALEMALAL